MIFKKTNKIKIGRKYELNGVECKALATNNNGNVVLVRENDGHLAFVIGDFQIKQHNILATEVMGFSISDTEMRDYLNERCAIAEPIDSTDVAKIIRKRYYKIPTCLAEVVASWYMSTYKC